MVEVTDPRLGETILDPASGTGGFLVESFQASAKTGKDGGRPEGSSGAITLWL